MATDTGRKPRRDLRRRIHWALRASPARIDVEQARTLLAAGATLVDVRRHDDPSLPLAGAIRIPPDELPRRLDELPRGAPVLLACT